MEMPLSLSETQAIADLSKHICSFLPGQAHPFADQWISFAGIARELGLDQFWPGGSKLPAITSLLEGTLEHKRNKFSPLILEVVRRGIKYRANKGNPVKRRDVEELNQLILKVGFKIPELLEESFLKSLPSTEEEKEEAEVVFHEPYEGPTIFSLTRLPAEPAQKKIFRFTKSRIWISMGLCLFGLVCCCLGLLDIKTLIASLIVLLFATYVLPTPRRK
jgi:hypothetical protein